jgi:hypothetical protein
LLIDFTALGCYTVSVKKKKRKHLIVQIEVTDLEDGQFYIDTTQLSNLTIPLTEYEKSTDPLKKNPVPKDELEQAIEGLKTVSAMMASQQWSQPSAAPRSASSARVCGESATS